MRTSFLGWRGSLTGPSSFAGHSAFQTLILKNTHTKRLIYLTLFWFRCIQVRISDRLVRDCYDEWKSMFYSLELSHPPPFHFFSIVNIHIIKTANINSTIVSLHNDWHNRRVFATAICSPKEQTWSCPPASFWEIGINWGKIYLPLLTHQIYPLLVHLT